MKITTVVLTYNEAERLRDCLGSIGWADTILVVDGGSTDSTTTIAREFTPHVVVSNLLGPEQPGGFAAQRNFALGKVETPWVFFLDADERCSPELAREIQDRIAQAPPAVDAFRICRQEYFFGIHSPYSHGSSSLVRIARTEKARWDERLVHESLVVPGKVDRLEHKIIHHSKATLAEYLATQSRYTTLEAEQARKSGVPLAHTPLPAMFRTFCNIYLYKGACREGVFGLLMAILMAQYSFLCWAKQWELEVRAGKCNPNSRLPWFIGGPANLLGGLWRALRPPRER